MDAFFNKLTLHSILTDKNFAKFGDSIVNFIYNAAIYEATNKMGGVKVWDKCLAQGCKDSPLRSFVGSKKDSGDLGDAVEAFIGYIYIKDKTMLNKMIQILSNFLKQKTLMQETNMVLICSEAFTHLLTTLCEMLNIQL